MRIKPFLLLLVMNIATLTAAPLDLGNFQKTPWHGMQAVNGPCPVPLPPGLAPNTQVACWKDLPKNPTLLAPKMPEDLSAYTHFDFWMYSSKKNNQGLTFYFDSEDPKSEGGDYFYYHLTVNWEGWRHFHLSTSEDIGISRKPLGWNHVKGLRVHSTGWEHEPLPSSLYYFADIRLMSSSFLHFDVTDKRTIGEPSLAMDATLTFKNDDETPREVSVQILSNPDGLLIDGLPDKPFQLAANSETSRRIRLRLPYGKRFKPMQSSNVLLQATTDNPTDSVTSQELTVTQPLVLPPHPRLFATADDIKRLKERSERLPWAQEARDTYIKYAERILTEPLNVPTMEGQWPHHYVCKKCGVGLRHVDGKHQCPRCNAVYTGWPYDQVVAGNVHGSNWAKIRTLGIAYAFSGKEAFAEKAREYLLAYVEQYPKFQYHNVYNFPTRSGGRMLAQTLDEAVGVIPMAWGYDLVYNSPCFSADDHKAIDDKLFREIAVTILRNDAGISNWQTWHNAGVAAIGFTIGDQTLIQKALFGKSGMLFQFKNSILKDGFWYEGTASYHFYSLDALIFTIEAALHAGLDYTHDPAFVSLFDAPLYYVTPELTFPAINDGDVMQLRNMNSYYEWAYSRIGKPEYASIAAFSKRKGERAFFFGVDDLPKIDVLSLKSRDFNGIGALVMRQNYSDGRPSAYVHFDYGPHGGGHGHQDKLALNVHMAGKLQAPDPGRLAYAAPMQNAWYRQTVAHCTVAIDGKSQAATTGKLLRFIENDNYCLAQAESDKAYGGVLLHRTVGLCDGVLFDIFDVESATDHDIDLLFHNFGKWTPKVQTELTAPPHPAGDKDGYQHIQKQQYAKTNDGWSVDIENQGTAACFVMNAAPDTELFFGEGIANNPPTPCPMVVIRRRGRSARFVSCIDYAPEGKKTRDIAIELLPNYTRDNPEILLTIDGAKHFIKP